MTVRPREGLHWPDACRTAAIRISFAESYLPICQRLLSSVRVFGNGTRWPISVTRLRSRNLLRGEARVVGDVEQSAGRVVIVTDKIQSVAIRARDPVAPYRESLRVDADQLSERR